MQQEEEQEADDDQSDNLKNKINSETFNLIEKLRLNLPKYIDDPNLTKLPFDVLCHAVDFKLVENDQESFQKVYKFCLDFLDKSEKDEKINRSELFSTLNAANISYEDLSKLTGNPNFDRTKLRDSLGIALSGIYERTDIMPKQVDLMKEKYQEDLRVMKERDKNYEKEQEETRKLREELAEQKQQVEELAKKVNEFINCQFFLQRNKSMAY